MHNPCPDARPENDLLGLDCEEITLADTLKKAGYATACIAKWQRGHQPRLLPRKPHAMPHKPPAASEECKQLECPSNRQHLTSLNRQPPLLHVGCLVPVQAGR